ncbi:hypothetical protein [Leuconostoc citreum]|uniref:hypothetical protein n=1 Tax=Leuconostoc citreum TaxID=33964 RepID=UPI00295859E1|nr:hypothetical protein [Leuconostoc citreum]MDV8931172.1 type I-E CRISPR-associated protein Cas6/Cse3/CasE [Leuconostoc citreum]
METVVRVETIEQWRSVLDVWFAQGYEWLSSKGYREDYFRNGSRQLRLNPINKITFSGSNLYSEDDCIEYADFMSQQEKTMAKETYYVTEEQLDFINTMYEKLYPLVDGLLYSHKKAKEIFDEFSIKEEKAVLRCLGGDTSIEFKVKEQLYRLWRIDDENDRVYFYLDNETEPDWTLNPPHAFTAPLEEINKWKTPAWDIEKAD